MSVFSVSGLAGRTSPMSVAVAVVVGRLDVILDLTAFFLMIGAFALFGSPLTDLAPNGSPLGCSG